LSKADYFVDSVDSATLFYLSARDRDLLGSAFAADAVNYAIHSLQSVHAIRATAAFPKVGAWQLIKAYYASFFAAHSMLRLFGMPFTNLEAGHVREILKVARASNSPISLADGKALSSGNYAIRYVADSKTLMCNYQPDSHKDLWAAFNSAIKRVSIEILSVRGPSEELQEISDSLTRLSNLLEKRGAYSTGNWLSVYRNEINYQASELIWFPFKKNEIASSALFASVRPWRSDRLNISDCETKRTEVESFFFTCLFIVQLMKSLMADYVKVADGCLSAALYKKYIALENGSGEV